MTKKIWILEPGRTERNYWSDLWDYRELFQVLAWRDVSVRYKQTVIGLLWAVLRPFLTMIVFTVVFGRIANLPSDGAAPYAAGPPGGLLTIADAQGDLHLWDTMNGRTSPLSSEMAARGPLA